MDAAGSIGRSTEVMTVAATKMVVAEEEEAVGVTPETEGAGAVVVGEAEKTGGATLAEHDRTVGENLTLR